MKSHSNGAYSGNQAKVRHGVIEGAKWVQSPPCRKWAKSSAKWCGFCPISIFLFPKIFSAVVAALVWSH